MARTRQLDILVTEDISGQPLGRLASSFRIEHRPDLWRDPVQLARRASHARALIIRNRTRIDRSLLDTARSNLRVIARAGAGLDNVDVAAADELGVVVIAAGGANSRSVAELALALALALARRLVVLDRDVRAGGWNRSAGLELLGRTWGVIGLGRTGLATAELATGMGMNVLGYDPFVEDDAAPVVSLGMKKTDLDAVLQASDVVSLHLPLSDSTYHLVDASFIDRMRRNALLINVARGEIVDEAALAEALGSGRLGGAGLDVRETEPPRPGPLDLLDSVIFTPHIGGITEAAQDRVLTIICDDLRRVLTGQPSRNAVGQLTEVR